jgi:hypothetical protein
MDQDHVWAEYYDARINNIKSQVTVADVLANYGIDVRTTEREFQYPCPLHGDGQDNSYSARMYPDNDDGSGGTYCFACHKSRDVIEWVRDYESLEFGKALTFVERTYHVQNIPRPHLDPEDPEERKKLNLHAPEVSKASSASGTSLQACEQMLAMLTRLAKARKVPYKKCVTMFFILDSLVFDLKANSISEDKARDTLRKVWPILQAC